ncbi:hypothetical protein JOD54_004448 [Actinokineospora baliensis]|uniref:hypothetical protein n=1 Tax=Actinokineospora baliensis TaxID=547056 RepID=UPI00195D210D|nr:hypothetical protein [Actinokineospora baliensis]MBM7774244.1 hypothetical protein [Actinokineospora baliensis]
MTAHPEVDWAELEHAYGSAEDTPEFIEALRGEDWEDAIENLSASILHQGTVYPATLPAVPLLVDVALDPEAPGRNGALWFVGAYAESISQGASESSHYLPEDIDIEEFDRDARAALADAAARLVPLLDDEDPEVRAAVYQFSAYLVGDPSAEVMMPLVRARFEREDDSAASVALMEPLMRHGLFTAADFETVLERGDDAITFAAAWAAVAERLDFPDAVEHVVRLWSEQAEDYPGNGEVASLSILASHAGPEAIPVVRGLIGSADTEVVIAGWVEIALASRTSTTEAVDGLLAMSPRDAPVVRALARVVPGAPDRTAAVCDAAAELADSGDAETAAAVAATLFAAKDPRWVAPALAVTASAEEPSVDLGSARSTFAYALIGFPAERRDLAWAAADLTTVTKAALAAWRHSTWVEVLAALPPSADVVAAADPSLDGLSEAMCELLARIAVTNPELVTEGPAGDGAWAITARAVIDPATDLDAAFRQAWAANGGDDNADDDLIDVWAHRPSEALRETCLRLLTGTANTSFPGRFAQLAAAKVVPEQAWPTVRAVVDDAEKPLADAVELAKRYPEHRAELVELLADIAENGRETWSGVDLVSMAVATRELVVLGEIDQQDAVDTAVELLFDAIPEHSAARIAPVIGEILAACPDARESAAERLSPLLNGDHRVPTASDTIADDVAIVAALRKGL